MATKKNTINLTPYFLIWSVIFIAVALIQSDWGWLWWAAAPWFFVIGFALVIWLFAAVVIVGVWASGRPITLTTPRKGTRIVQRGRKR